MDRVPIVMAGLGPVGRLCARFASQRPELNIVGAADIDPDLAGRDLGELLGQAPLGVKVAPQLEQALKGREKGVVVLCTGSYLKDVAPQIVACLAAGWPVVSTCEQLAYPFGTAPEESRAIDEAARKAGLAVLGTGVNPGFTMDALPAFLSGVMVRVEAVLVERFQDASKRRLPFQRKIGAGLSLSEFQEQAAAGIIRHVGFAESVHLIAAAWGIALERLEEQVMPVMATRPLQSEFMEIEPGRVCGVNQLCQGFHKDRAVITLHLEAYFGHPEPKERVVIQGEPPLESVVQGGIFGDTATCAMAINAIAPVRMARPGLRTMLDVGLVAGRLR
jgi:4-hydroxy-tetrahydrodipicolinate reductase